MPAAAAPQGGPFAATAPAGAPGTAAPLTAPAPPLATVTPLARPSTMPGAAQPNAAQPNAAQPAGTPNPNPAARVTTDAAAAPMTPEELLERRRARRTPQNQ